MLLGGVRDGLLLLVFLFIQFKRTVFNKHTSISHFGGPSQEESICVLLNLYYMFLSDIHVTYPFL